MEKVYHFLQNMPVWGSLDILEACGASDSGSNPDAGVPFYQVVLLFELIFFLFRENRNMVSRAKEEKDERFLVSQQVS